MPVPYKQSVSRNATYLSVRSLYDRWNGNHSIDNARVFAPSTPEKRESDSDIWLLGSSHLHSLNDCASNYEETKVFRNHCVDSASSISVILQGFSDTLRPMAAHYGKKYYNKYDPIETLLKDVVDFLKDFLAYMAKLVDCSPLMGVALYPIVYQVKCIIDEILDITENCSDEIINELRALLNACSCGSDLGGLCPGLIGSLLQGATGL
ncbi:hypothetical protein L218DRAFT_992873 [Marasmius fiardii PR-910]|nr:hypothetical protein L218DRAFT_992873 [Marasmius fiardii PR-910]